MTSIAGLGPSCLAWYGMHREPHHAKHRCFHRCAIPAVHAHFSSSLSIGVLSLSLSLASIVCPLCSQSASASFKLNSQGRMCVAWAALTCSVVPFTRCTWLGIFWSSRRKGPGNLATAGNSRSTASESTCYYYLVTITRVLLRVSPPVAINSHCSCSTATESTSLS